MGYLLLQDATKKWRHISQTRGECTVSITLSIEGVGLFVTVPEKKRNKEKYMISKCLSQFDYSTPQSYILLKDTEQKTCVLLHLDMDYPMIMPFLRGLYLTMKP